MTVPTTTTLDLMFSLRCALEAAGDVLTPPMRAVLLALAALRDRDGSIVCARTQIEAVTGLSRSTVADALRRLVRLGVVELERRVDERGGNLPSHYQIHPGRTPRREGVHA